MKQRSALAATANAGVNALRSYCDRFGLVFQAEPREDFGIDCYLEVAVDRSPLNFIVGVQVKSGASYRRDQTEGTFTISVRRDDIHYWLAANYPVLFVYYHEANGLYFRHVQDAFNGAQSLTECTSLNFSEADRAESDAMAEYVRGLARVTPSIISRLEVLSGPANLLIGRERVALGAAHSGSRLSFERFRATDLEDLQTRLPIYPRVLGYSRDCRWVCELHVPDPGPRGLIDADVILLDLHEHASLLMRLFTGDELEAIDSHGQEFDWERYNRTLDRLEDAVRIMHLEEARTMYYAYDLTIEAKDRLPLGIAFGEESFRVEIGAHEGRDALILSAHQYRPPRQAPVLLERAPFAYTAIAEDEPLTSVADLMRMEQAPRFEFLAGLTASHSGELLTFAVMTNDTHGCWGTRTVHLSHVRVAEIRATCADALRH